MFEPNETIKVTDGPFMNFSGLIEEVDQEETKNICFNFCRTVH